MVKNLPSVTSPLPRDLQMFIQRVREAMDGGGLDGLVTARQMVAAGIASFSNGSVSSTGPSTIDAPRPPTNLAGSGALASVILTWDGPTYSGHAYTEIWAATQTGAQVSASEAPVMSQAELVGMTAGNNFSHNIGNSGTRYYWVRNVNQDGLVSAFNATNGLAVSTGNSPAHLLELLTGEITSSVLHTDLGTRISLIDGDASVTGSVNQRVQTVATVANGNTAAIQVSADSINGVQGKFTVKIDNNNHVSGFGLISTANDATPTAAFGVRADQFWVAPPAVAPTANAPTSNLYVGQAWTNTADPPVTKYYDGSAWQTTPPNTPFVVRTTPGPVNGVTVPAGVYIDTAMIADATITQAKIGTLTADVITSGLLNTADFHGKVIAGTNIYLGGSVAFTQDANGNNDGIAPISSWSVQPKVAMTSTGAAFDVNGFTVVNNGGTDATPFSIVNNEVTIDTALIRDGTITMAKIENSIQSTNYVASGGSATPAGWKLTQDGTIDLTSGTVTAGTLKSTDGNFVIDLTNGTLTISV